MSISLNDPLEKSDNVECKKNSWIFSQIQMNPSTKLW